MAQTGCQGLAPAFRPLPSFPLPGVGRPGSQCCWHCLPCARQAVARPGWRAPHKGTLPRLQPLSPHISSSALACPEAICTRVTLLPSKDTSRWVSLTQFTQRTWGHHEEGRQAGPQTRPSGLRAPWRSPGGASCGWLKNRGKLGDLTQTWSVSPLWGRAPSEGSTGRAFLIQQLEAPGVPWLWPHHTNLCLHCHKPFLLSPFSLCFVSRGPQPLDLGPLCCNVTSSSRTAPTKTLFPNTVPF